MKWHDEVLDAAGHAAAVRLAAATGSFYLAGGTALALRLGHRVSLDLDLFSARNKLGAEERRTLLDALKASGPLKIKGVKFYIEVLGEGSVTLRKNGQAVAYQPPGTIIQ